MPILKTDPHKAWLSQARALNARVSSGLPDDQPGTVPSLKLQIRDLQNKMADTDPETKEGILALVGLLCDLAWADLPRRVAENLRRNVKMLWPD